MPANLESIRFLYEKGIVQGYPDGTFRGREYMTRYQVAAMLYRTYLVFADDVAKRVREALAQDSQAR
ncbi:MAG: S-layer homology domain-containing protein, partial [Bacillota bacterium]